MSTMEERESIKQSLEDHQRDFREAVEELKQVARTYTDPRDPIREHPARWLTVAVGVGLWFGWRR